MEMGSRRPRLTIALAVTSTWPGSVSSTADYGLIHLRIAEDSRKLHRSGLDDAARHSGQHVRKRWRAAAVVRKLSSVGRMKKLRSPLSEPVWVSAVSSVAFSVRP
jgi:hypothetical protein